MIALLQGEICHLSAPNATIMTTIGVGYEVELPLSSFVQLRPNDTATIWTHLVVREDAQVLCGFIHRHDRDAFRKLIKINGVGAKMALAMLSNLSASEINHAIETGNELTLTRIPGVGKKTAQRLIIELKGKLNEFVGDVNPLADNFDGTLFESVTPNEMAILAEVESALLSLGYKEKEAQTAIKNAKVGLDNVDTQSLLKATLKQLAKF